MSTVIGNYFRGPNGATDEAFLRFDGGSGRVGQNSVVTSDDKGNTSINQVASTSGTPNALNIVCAAHNGIIADNQLGFFDVQVLGNRTVTFDGTNPIGFVGNFAIEGSTFDFDVPQTIFGAANHFILGTPSQGTNNTMFLSANQILSGTNNNTDIAAAQLVFMPGIADGVGNVSGRGGIVIADQDIEVGDQTATTTFMYPLYIGPQTFNSTTNVRTISSASSLFIKGAPIAGTNVVFSDGPYSIYVQDGMVLSEDGYTFKSTSSSNKLTLAPSVFTSTYTLTMPVADGTAGQVLATDGAGTLSFVTAGSGSAITEFDASVGATGADYTTISAAVTAGKYRLLVVDNVTEVADVTFPTQGFYMYVETGFTVDMGDFAFLAPVPFAQAQIDGGGEATITYNHTTSRPLFSQNGNEMKLSINGMVISNTSTVNDTPVCDGEVVMDNCVVECGNASRAGIASYQPFCRYSNVEIVGGGVNCDFAIDGDNATNENNPVYTAIRMLDVFVTGGSIAYFASHDVVQGMIVDISQPGNFLLDSYCKISNVSTVNTPLDLLFVDQSFEIALSNVQLGVAGTGGIVSVDGTGETTEPQISNLICDSVDMTANFKNGNFVNCWFKNPTDVLGQRNKFTNVHFEDSISVTTGADNNGFINCQVGSDGGGGTSTITTQVNCDNTRIIGCMVDASISDNGTGTILLGNVVY